MFTYCWWQGFLARYRAAAYRRLRCGISTCRVQLEVLEDRLVPATVEVTGTADSAIITSLVHLPSGLYTAPNLRSAVAGALALPGSNTILLGAGQTYDLSQGELAIQHVAHGATALTIKTSGGSATATIQANSTSRIFEVFSGVATTLNNLTLTGGVDVGGADVGGGAILNHGALTLTNDQLTSNQANGGGLAPAEGGAILNQGQLTLSNDQLTGNQAVGASGSADESAMGGAIFNDSGGSLTMTDCTLDSNAATGGSSDTLNVAGADGDGGGMWINSGSRPVTITASTFSNNQVFGGSFTGPGAGNAGGAYGGGLALDQAAIVVKIANSTFFNNSCYGGSASGVPGAGYGGNAFGAGINAQNQNSLRLVNDTIADNQLNAASGFNGGGNGNANGGGVNNFGGNSTVQLVNTIIAQNVSNDPNSGTPSPNDVSGTFDSLGHNFIGNADGASGFSVGLHDQLGSASTTGIINPDFDPNGLQNNGGPTETIALVAYSTAINTGNNAVTFSSTLLASLGISPLGTDQRGPGFARLVDGTVDIGAYEFQMNLNKVYSLASNRTQSVTLTVKAPGLLLGSAAFALPFKFQSYAVELVGSPPAGTSLKVNADGSFTFTIPPRYGSTVAFLFRVLVENGEETFSTNLVFSAVIEVKSSGFGRGSAGDYL